VVAKVVVEAATRKTVTAPHRGFCGPSGDIAAAVRAVDVAAGEFVGRPLVEVQTRLAARGLRVQPRTIATGQVPAGQVIAVDPVGPVAPDGSVTVTYAVAPAVQADEEDGDGNGNGNGGGVGEDDSPAVSHCAGRRHAWPTWGRRSGGHSVVPRWWPNDGIHGRPHGSLDDRLSA
jgi:hypothetical protein